MRPLTAAGLLHAWEGGPALRPFDRALALLAAAQPEEGLEGLAQLTVGERDGRLLQLRQVSFGSVLRAFAACPSCGTEWTFGLRTEDLRGEPPQRNADQLFDVEAGGVCARFRLPTLADFAHLPAFADLAAVRQQLAHRCVIETVCDGLPTALDSLPPELIDAMSAKMADQDPQAEVRIALTCSACNHSWSALFDIAAFFCAEIAAAARRLLREVDALARAYGWREPDILALTPWRRDAYLQLVNA